MTTNNDTPTNADAARLHWIRELRANTDTAIWTNENIDLLLQTIDALTERVTALEAQNAALTENAPAIHMPIETLQARLTPAEPPAAAKPAVKPLTIGMIETLCLIRDSGFAIYPDGCDQRTLVALQNRGLVQTADDGDELELTDLGRAALRETEARS